LTDVTFFIGVAALVGAIVLAGVTELFRRYAGTATASDT
jgi:Na+/H+ antiporter NhaD/arsenite permease-like protein